MANLSKIFIPGRTWIRGIIGIALGALFFWLALRQSSWAQVQSILSQANDRWLVIDIGFYAANMAVRVVRWRSLLWYVKPLSFWSVGMPSYLCAWICLLVVLNSFVLTLSGRLTTKSK